jgi:deoxyribodipyrimidine photo-lyase
MNSIFWFRNDLRLGDNRALTNALKAQNCYLIYIYDVAKQKEMGAAQKVWLDKSLTSLNEDITNKGGKLNIFVGDPIKIISEIVEKHNINEVFWNRRYYLDGVNKDKEIKENLKAKNVTASSYKSTMLTKEPWEILNKQGNPYKVFTPYYKAVRSLVDIDSIPSAQSLKNTNFNISSQVSNNLELTPQNLAWPQEMLSYWDAGEKNGLCRLQDFTESEIEDYPQNRDLMAKDGTSKLSIYLPLGQISTQIIVNQLLNIEPSQANEAFLRQVIWREFANYLLWHFQNLPTDNFNDKFSQFKWLNNEQHFQKWQQGQTGYPIVDAGMRELWQTGYMHNRVRMVVGSFLTKHLLIDWQLGEKWFWDTLIDADIAVNPVSWQWVSGCGVDAAPYFRVFNPWLQSQKFDPKAEYIKKWVPELRDVSASNIHNPKKISGYIEPIIDHDFARRRALDEYQKIK